MKLLMDCGNTLVKFAWLDNNQRHASQAMSYDDLGNLKKYIQAPPEKVLGSIVASQNIKNSLIQAFERFWNIEITWCNLNDGKTLLHNYYANTLGSDRWFGLLGLLGHIQHEPKWLTGTPYILASFGTATTVDTIRLQTLANGKQQASFLGGLILPGAELMRQSLAQGTADLPLAQGAITDFPLDTNSAINSGIAAAQSGALLRQWKKASLLGEDLHPQIYACGGAWPVVNNHVLSELAYAQAQIGFPDHPVKWLDNPVLDGLALISKNKS